MSDREDRESTPSSPHPTSANPTEASCQTTAQHCVLSSLAGHSSSDCSTPPSSSSNPTSPHPTSCGAVESASSGCEGSSSGSLLVVARFSSQSSSESSCSSGVYSYSKCTPVCINESGKCEFKDIGTGKYGQVFEARHEGKVYAAKKYLGSVSSEDLYAFFDTLIGLRHENIVTYHGVYNMKHSDGSQYPVVLMDLLKQTLSAVVEDTSRALEANATLLILHDIVCGLHFLHEKGIFHCDLIPQNVLLTAELRAKVSDYGNTRVKPIHTALAPQDRYVCDYLPPEAIDGTAHDAKVDAFSFGHLLLYILLRRQPHPLLKPVSKQIARSEFERRGKYITEVSERIGNGPLQPLLKWIELFLDNNSCNRPQVTQILTVLFL